MNLSLEKKELWLYAFVWTLVFAIVPLSLFIHVLSGNDMSMAWTDVLQIWGSILPYFVLFLLHNHLAAPFMLNKKVWPYVVVTIVLIAVFIAYCLSFPSGPPEAPGFDSGPRPAPPDGRRPVEPRVMKIVIGMLVVLVNLGVKAVFINIRNERKMHELQTQTLAQQMETLRYQINPHFFMNTLNNIHALVDIDPEKAKESIEEFSRLMRIVLYEGDSATIPLDKEIEYLKHFVVLMRLRYPEEVDIKLKVPDNTGDAVVPPLVMATFAENAFKHGISYQATSFVHITVAVEGDKIVFKCANSRHLSGQPYQHGLGLENMRKRLELLYGQNYTLHIEESDSVYEIIMLIPAK